jgi:hypothetical protein
MSLTQEALQTLDGISAALSDLVSIHDGAHKDALQSVSVALSEMVQLMEAAQSAGEEKAKASAEAMRKIAEAVAGMNLAPQISVQPTINVPSQPLEVSVKAGENHIHVQAPPATDSAFKHLKIEFTFRGDQIVGADIVRKA